MLALQVVDGFGLDLAISPFVQFAPTCNFLMLTQGICQTIQPMCLSCIKMRELPIATVTIEKE